MPVPVDQSLQISPFKKKYHPGSGQSFRIMNIYYVICVLSSLVVDGTPARRIDDEDGLALINRPHIKPSATEDAINEGIFIRKRRYLGLSKRYKLNRRYQECIAPGDVEGHCKHLVYCPMDIVGITGKAALDYLCIIDKLHVGVCCPDDILLRTLTGAQLIMDLPAGGDEYEKEDQQTGCGLTVLARPRNHQISSSPAKRWPWLAALFKPRDQKQQFCGGALITDRHILTAAHCLVGLKADDIRVRLGEYDFEKFDETRSRDFAIIDIANHEEFNRATYENDLAILTLDKSVNFNSYMWPICLPPVNRSYEKDSVTVAGWGQQYYAGPTSNVLLEVTMPVWEQQKCIDSFAQRIRDTNICAAGLDGGKDSCLGDSGGPLVFQLENGRWVAIGIVSWGIGCGDKGQPGIYTRVDKYISWIVRHTIVK